MSEELDALREALRWVLENGEVVEVGDDGYEQYWEARQCCKVRRRWRNTMDKNKDHAPDCPYGTARRLAGLDT